MARTPRQVETSAQTKLVRDMMQLSKALNKTKLFEVTVVVDDLDYDELQKLIQAVDNIRALLALTWHLYD